MTVDEMEQKAMERVKKNNPNGSNFDISKVYENIMDGTVISVSFQSSPGKEDYNHVYFVRDEIWVYGGASDVLTAISNTKERNPFFRFIELVGINGVIGFILVIFFAILLGAFAIFKPDVDAKILDIVKLSFTIILGYFFGSQTSAKK